MRIIQLVMVNKRLTAHQIAEAQSDIPLTTLYRQLNMLVDGGILIVVEERRVRGTVERVYEVANNMAALELEGSKKQSREDHMELFTIFATLLMSSFHRYLQQAGEHADFLTDGVRYRQIPLHLSTEEFHTFFAELQAVIDRWQDVEPSPERTERFLSLVTLPEKTL
jgi:DNA-binding transcriptional ArsR family regulator